MDLCTELIQPPSGGLPGLREPRNLLIQLCQLGVELGALVAECPDRIHRWFDGVQLLLAAGNGGIQGGQEIRNGGRLG
eukprot:8902706-Alexandrium_andersonii.AAC.1